MSHLLVTGGAGYIGSHALRNLQRAGHTTVGIDGGNCLELVWRRPRQNLLDRL